MKLSEALKKVIRLAQASRDYWDAELPKRHPDYPLVRPGEDSGPPPPQEAQLRKLLTGLPADMVHQLILIMDLGRRNLAPEDLAERFGQIKEEFDDPEWAVSLLIDKAPLADYLLDGLEKLSKDGIDVDKLPLKPAKART